MHVGAIYSDRNARSRRTAKSLISLSPYEDGPTGPEFACLRSGQPNLADKLEGKPTMSSKRFVSAVVALATAIGFSAVTPAVAAPISVDIFANQNSSSGGVAVDTGLDLATGDRLVSIVDPLDCWSAGAANRISNANGLDGLSPSPCQPTGDYGFHSQDGETFRYGALVGRIDAGDWFLLGTNFDAVINATGRLFLVYWDSNFADNFGAVTALISVNPSEAPAPGTLALLGLGLVGLAATRRRKQ